MWNVTVSVARIGAVSVVVSSMNDKPESSSSQVRFSISHKSTFGDAADPVESFALG